MASFVITDEEWLLLFDLPAEDAKLYCDIRHAMNFNTGIAGIYPRLSEQRFRELLTVPATRGRHCAKSLSRQQVRTILTRLKEAGLLVSKAEHGPLVFELPLAYRVNPSKGRATDVQPEDQPNEQPTLNNINHKDTGYEQPDEQPAKSSKSNPPLNTDTTTNFVSSNKGATRKFRWQDFPVPDGVDPGLWREWMENRKTNRAAMTRLALQGIEKKLSALRPTHDLGELVAHANISGWKTVFPCKEAQINGASHENNPKLNGSRKLSVAEQAVADEKTWIEAKQRKLAAANGGGCDPAVDPDVANLRPPLDNGNG